MINKLLSFLHSSGEGSFQKQNRVRILLLALMSVLMLMFAARFLVRVYDDYAQNIQNEIEMKTARYENLSRLMADEDRYRQEHETLLRFRSNFLDDRLIQASTSSRAETRLQNIIDELADQSGLNVLSLRMLPSTQQGDITNLKIEIKCRGEIGAIQDFLQSASNHDKFIFVDQINIRILNQRERRHYNFNAQLVAWTIS